MSVTIPAQIRPIYKALDLALEEIVPQNGPAVCRVRVLLNGRRYLWHPNLRLARREAKAQAEREGEVGLGESERDGIVNHVFTKSSLEFAVALALTCCLDGEFRRAEAALAGGIKVEEALGE